MGDVLALPKRCAWEQCGLPIRDDDVQKGRVVAVQDTEGRVFHAAGCYGLHLTVEAAKQGLSAFAPRRER